MSENVIKFKDDIMCLFVQSMRIAIMKEIFFNKNLTEISETPYYLGLDIGTSSVGFAATNRNYELIHKSNKDIWGAHLFNEAQTAKERRLFRANARRMKRRKFRMEFIRSVFKTVIDPVDPKFFDRLDESFAVFDHRKTKTKNILFNDKSFNDKKFRKQYPTISHLRHKLAQPNDIKDPRLYFLAVNNIMKNRGHFLFQSKPENFDTSNNIENTFGDLKEKLSDVFGEDIFDCDYSTIIECLMDTENDKTDKAKHLKKCLKVDYSKNDIAKGSCELLAGKKYDFNKIRIENMVEEDEDENNEVVEQEKKSMTLDEYMENEEYQSSLESSYPETKALLDVLAASSYAVMLAKLMHGASSISESRIKIYEKHNADLAKLKKLLKWMRDHLDYDKKTFNALYNEVFWDNKEKLNNYVAYSGHANYKQKGDHGLKINTLSSCSQEDFNNYLSKNLVEKHINGMLEKNIIVDGIDLNAIKNEITNGTFMPRIKDKGNGVIPYQLHYVELKKIIGNAIKNLNGFTSQSGEQILAMMSFRIPYFVGPYDDRSEYAWIVRKEGHKNTSIRPWNFEEVVDVKETAAAFITNLTNNCKYLLGEKVLPKQSLLYSEFMIRNLLNVVRVGGRRLDAETLERIYQDLFVNGHEKVTKNRLAKHMVKIGAMSKDDELTGIDNEIPHNLNILRRFAHYLDNEILTYDDVEQIIEKLTIFPDHSGNQIFSGWLKEKFGDKLSDEDVAKISKIKCVGWGTLSRKFLEGIKIEVDGLQEYTIMDFIRLEGLNLMETLYKKGFMELIESENGKLAQSEDKLTEEDLKLLRISPPVEKAIRKTLKITNEISRIMGGAPEKIFVEMARENKPENKNKRTESRKSKLLQLFKDKDSPIYQELLEIADDKLKRKSIYLYFTQEGRCLYTGRRINLDDLFDNKSNKYNIDHIFPRSLTKDDSFDNLALVETKENMKKEDDYPLPTIVQENQRDFWTSLRRKGLISEKKYERLKRVQPLGPEELEQFVNRQLVETRQITKAVASIIGRFYKNSKIIFVKANLVSDFRYMDGTREKAKTKFKFMKNRDVNDYHHAQDAYLNIVVGNVYHTKFNTEFYKLLKNRVAKYSLPTLFDHEVQNAWTPGETGTIKTIKQMMEKETVMLTKEKARNTGKFFDMNTLKRGLGEFPVKTTGDTLSKKISDYYVAKDMAPPSDFKDGYLYGGKSNVYGSHYVLVKIEGKKGGLCFLNIPIYLVKDIENDEKLHSYLKGLKEIKSAEFKVLNKKINFQTIVNIDGTDYELNGRTSTSIRCKLNKQTYYSQEFIEKLRTLSKDAENNVEVSRLQVHEIKQMFVELVSKMKLKPFFSVNSISEWSEKLSEDEVMEKFEALPPAKQYKIITSLLSLLKGECNGIDLSPLYDGKNKSVMTININQKQNTDLRIINKSITGFYENSILYKL